MPDSIRIDEIREQQEYQGQRVRLVAYLGSARIPLQIDIGFGDAVTPHRSELSIGKSSLAGLISQLHPFLAPPLLAANAGEPFSFRWVNGDSWQG